MYYRNFRRPGGATLWTFSLSLAYPLLLFAVVPMVWIFRPRRGGERGFTVGEL